MRISKLDGFGRVQTQTDPQNLNGPFRMTRKAMKRRKRKQDCGAANVDGGGRGRGRGRGGFAANTSGVGTGENSKMPRHEATGTGVDKPKTKRAARQAKHASRSRMQGSPYADGANPDIGFSRVYEGNDPRQMQGFGRIRYTNQQLQGLSLQGHMILQGYGVGDEEDLDDWNYLLSIEHPETLQGFPSWVLNGKAERKARQANKTAKKTAKRETKAGKKETKSAGKQAKAARKQRKKEVKTAKKEERLRKGQSKTDMKAEKKAAKIAREQQKLDDKAAIKAARQETKRQKSVQKAASKMAKSSAKADGKEARSNAFANFTETALPMAADLISGRGDFEQFSVSSFDNDDFGGGLDDYISGSRSRTSEDILNERDQVLDFMDEIPEDDFELEDEDDDKGGNSMMMPLLLAAGVGLVMMNKNKGKKKK
jgi:hypothetical protein